MSDDVVCERTMSCDEALLREAFDLYEKAALVHTKGCRTKSCQQQTDKCCLKQKKIKGYAWLSKFLTERQKRRLFKAVIRYNKTKKRNKFDKVMARLRKKLGLL